MKKYTLLIVVGIMMILCSAIGLKESFGAEVALNYNGHTKEFTYSHLDKHDLFDNFKDLVPGDTRSQHIKIKAYNIDVDTKVYLKLNENINAQLLDYVDIFYYVNGVQLEESDDVVLLQELDDDMDIDLEIIIEVPVEVGNEVSDFSHSLLWTFLVEEDDSGIIVVPDTGENNIVIDVVLEKGSWVFLAVGFTVAIYGIFKKINKRR